MILLCAVNMHYSHWLIINLFGLQQGRIRFGGTIKVSTGMKRGGVEGDCPRSTMPEDG